VAGRTCGRAASRRGRGSGTWRRSSPCTAAERAREPALLRSAYNLRGEELRRGSKLGLAEFGLEPVAEPARGALPGATSSAWPWRRPLHEPEILFLDEPTSGVDPLARREFWAAHQRRRRSGTTVVVTTHFMEEAEYCDRMLIMARGAELALGTPAEIRALARSAERPDPTIEDAFILLSEQQAEAAA
jgi:ABC-2 type transport system ATP-binding protein